MATKGFGAKEINISGEVGTPTIETGGNLTKAAELAGYSGNYHQVIKSLRQEVIEFF